MIAAVVFTIAHSTGWDEEKILWMPLRRSLQYLHAAWVNLGTATEWRSDSECRQQDFASLFEKLKHLTKSDV